MSILQLLKLLGIISAFNYLILYFELGQMLDSPYNLKGNSDTLQTEHLMMGVSYI